MGIKGLWTVLTPYSEKKSLHEIRGETIAVDLSGWVCDSQNVTEYHVQPKLYLRNLFFRTIYLILVDINPIFVLEGDAPDLKRNVMAIRNAVQFRGAAPKTSNNTKTLPDVSRNRFKNVLKECESLLKCMGVRCVKGNGEAEATCAQMNLQGLVDAVVSQDSDCFAYGARRVYRNFSVSSSSGGGAMQGSVDCYDASIMYNRNGFGRNKMVALALMCGCDYGAGACGSSINTVIQFLHTVPENDIISRLLSWVAEPEEYDKKARWVAAPGRCDRCGHVGRTHLKNGCPVCATHRGCNDLGHKLKVAEVKRELSLRSRALSCGSPFPEPKVMKEFLNSTGEKIDIDSIKNIVPSLVQFVKLMRTKLDWRERYCVEKFLPLLTKWHLQDSVPIKTIQPQTIKKKRNPRGVPCYEVVWTDIDRLYEGLIPDDQFEEGEDPAIVWISIERQDLMRKYYPDIVEAFEESIKKPSKEKKRKDKKHSNNENIDKPKRKYNRKAKGPVNVEHENKSTKNCKTPELNNSALNVSVCVTKLKRKLKNTKKGTQKTIDSFVAKKKRKSMKKTMESLKLSFNNMSINKDDNKYASAKKDLNYSSFLNKTEDDVDESDLSDVIENIVRRRCSTEIAKVGDDLVKLVFDRYTTPKKRSIRESILKDVHNNCSTPNESPIRNKRFSVCKNSFNNSLISKVNTSYFFDKLTEDRDAFEMSIECKDKSASNVDCDTTVEYSLPDVCL